VRNASEPARDGQTREVPGIENWPYGDRRPHHEMEAEEVARILGALEDAAVTVWLDGGWGVDALLGEQVREHDDVDLVVELSASSMLTEVLASLGYMHVAGDAPSSFVLVDVAGRQVDVHPVAFDEEGGGVYRMEDGRDWTYPAEGFSGRGRVGGLSVLCLDPATQVLVHSGYELTAKDYVELRLLHERFGVELPEHVREALAGGSHGS
jgi:lincosamide nucleotidyltransferase A/C/D/E